MPGIAEKAQRQADAIPAPIAVDMKEAARLLSTTIETLRHCRKRRIGPVGFRMGTKVVYEVADLHAFLRAARDSYEDTENMTTGTQDQRDDAAHAKRLRRAARRQGLTLEKSRTRDRRAPGWGWRVVDTETGDTVAAAPSGYGLTLDAVESFLFDGDGGDEYDDDLRDAAMYLAMCVRNAMEDFHHDHLSDDQMAILNPIIRNAIYSGLFAQTFANPGDPDDREGAACAAYLAFQTSLIPDYWEAPELLDDLTNLFEVPAERLDRLTRVIGSLHGA